jgi:ABC-type uncharacterized transport system involved in gliding motility auxiliary subunit
MNPRWHRYAPLGLYISGLAAIVSAGLYIVFHTFNLALEISLGFIIIGMAIFILLDPEKARVAITGRQARYGSNAFVLSVAVFGILVVINYLVYKNPYRWDLTQDKTHTLAVETINTLKTLSQPVKVEAFFTTNLPTDTAKTLLDSYKYNGQGKFDYTFIDPNSNPAAATAANITQDGTVVLTMGTHKEVVTTVDEQDLTSALLRLINPGEKDIYFLIGDGEFDTTATSGNEAYSLIDTTLKNKNYTVNTLNLVSTPKIPDKTLAIIIAGPQKPLSANEVTLLKGYLDKGGSVIYFAESPFVTNTIGVKDPLADYLATSWGIKLGVDVVIDPNVNPKYVAVESTYGNHAITNKLNNAVSIYPTARSIEVGTVPSTVTQTILVQTAANAWGETDYTSVQAQTESPDPSKDNMGPVTLAMAATDSTTNARLVVVGDAEFASDQFFSQYANGDFAANAVDWAAQQESQISLTPKQTTSRFMAPPEAYVMNLILLGAVFVLPGAIIVAGILTWVQRRRRG